MALCLQRISACAPDDESMQLQDASGLSLVQDSEGASLSEDSEDSPEEPVRSAGAPHHQPSSGRRPRSRLSRSPDLVADTVEGFAGRIFHQNQLPVSWFNVRSEAFAIQQGYGVLYCHGSMRALSCECPGPVIPRTPQQPEPQDYIWSVQGIVDASGSVGAGPFHSLNVNCHQNRFIFL